MNTVKTIIFMGILAALMLAVGGLIGGRQGLTIALVFALVTNLGSYWFSSSIALRMANAIPISEAESPYIYTIVRKLCAKANLPMPSINLIPTSSPNAFATGRDIHHAAIAVTQGILELLDEEEIEAVLAHELSHVKNQDVLITTIACVLVSVISYLANFLPYIMGYDRNQRDSDHPIALLVMIILAPITASLINLAISRSREYEADASGAHICGNPQALASALAKIEATVQYNPLNSQNQALSSLYIIKPAPGNWLLDLMSTHPATAKRIAKLEAMNLIR